MTVGCGPLALQLTWNTDFKPSIFLSCKRATLLGGGGRTGGNWFDNQICKKSDIWKAAFQQPFTEYQDEGYSDWNWYSLNFFFFLNQMSCDSLETMCDLYI